MQRTTNKRNFFFGGLIAIVLLYTLYNLFLADASYYRSIPRKLRHVVRFFTILSVYGIGVYSLRKFAVSWMLHLWHMIYILAIILILAIGIYDWTYGLDTNSARNFASSLTELLISPVLIATMGIVNSRIKN